MGGVTMTPSCHTYACSARKLDTREPLGTCVYKLKRFCMIRSLGVGSRRCNVVVLQQCSGNNQGTFREHSGNIQGVWTADRRKGLPSRLRDRRLQSAGDTSDKQLAHEKSRDANLKLKTESEPEERQSLTKDLAEVWRLLIGPKLREDKSDEARALYRALLVVQGDVSISFTSEEKRIADEEYMSLTLEYYGARTKSITSSASFRRLVPSFNLTANLVVVGVLCRVILPRILAIGAGGDVYEFASAYGLPDKEVLEEYIRQIQDLPIVARFSLFTAFYIFERITLTTEFLPIGFVLPFVSPVVFGGVAAGASLTALAATLGSSVNFFLGKTVLKERVANFQFNKMPPLSSNGWFKALYRRFDSTQFPGEFPSQGFKSALLLRLAPILPVPVDAHWYILGTTDLAFGEFFLAHLIGVFKVALLDAFLGYFAFEALLDSAEVQQQAQYLLYGETAILVFVSIAVTNTATGMLTQILDEAEEMEE